MDFSPARRCVGEKLLGRNQLRFLTAAASCGISATLQHSFNVLEVAIFLKGGHNRN